MKDFVFEGDWEIRMNLQKIIESNNKWGEYKSNKHELINLKIGDIKNLDPDPITEQLNAIQYIIQNQDDVLERLCNALNKINKKYGEYNEEHDWYPENLTVNNLGTIFYLSEIEILVEHKEGVSYLQFKGEYKGDYEHGLVLVLHRDKLIGFKPIDDDLHKEIYKDLGDQGESIKSFNVKHQDFGKNQVHQPIPKYGKHKPWQINEMDEYFENLLKEKNNVKLINEYQKSGLNINFRFPFYDRDLLEMAIAYKNTEIINLLIEKGADTSNSLNKCTDRMYFDKENINCLISNGISIDTITYGGLTPLGDEIKNYAWLIGSLANYNKGETRYKLAIDELMNSKKKIEFYIQKGANPNNIDQNGNDYISILEKHHNQKQLRNHKVYNVLANIIDPEKIKSHKWKFWKN